MLQIDREISGAFRLDQVAVHNTAEILEREPLRLRTPAQSWAYSAAFEFQRAAFQTRDGNDAVVVDLDLEVEQGEVGVGGLTEDMQEFLGPETSVAAAAGRTRARVVISDPDRFRWLMIRNGSEAGRPAVLRLHSVQGYTARGGHPPDLFEAPSPQLDNLAAAENSASPLIISELLTASDRNGAGLDRYFQVLRRKWEEVPAGMLGRRRTSDLIDLPDEQLKAEWLAMQQEAISGEGFEVRGWYELLYRDFVRGKKLLDVGSGLGLDTILFARRGARVTFVDVVETNLEILRRLCRIFGVENAGFLYLENLACLDSLADDFDVIWCQGSMINAPFEYMKIESHVLLRHLPVGGRWIELAYPKQRWEREGCLPFGRWGEKTDGAGTPWMEWYDLEKWRARMHPGEFDLVLDFNFHNDDFCWFDLVRTK